MSKKQKRQVAGVSNRSVNRSASASSLPASPEAARPQAVSSRPGSSAEFKPDYSYVISDLKRIGILAVSFTVVLVALSFILN